MKPSTLFALGYFTFAIFAAESGSMANMPWPAQLLVALAVAAPGVIAAWKINSVAAKQDTSIDNTDKKLEVIHDLTNSNFTAIKEQLKTALARIQKLEEEKMVKAVDDVEKARSVPPMLPLATPDLPAPPGKQEEPLPEPPVKRSHHSKEDQAQELKRRQEKNPDRE
jgi:hypothetical protein